MIIFGQISIAQKSNSLGELNQIDQKLNESIYVSTNSNSYLIGETILYKIFCIDKITNSTKTNSKVAYLQLIDSNKKSVFTHKIFLQNGVGNGDFFLPTTLETGSYKLIGYTNWMLNKGIESFFSADLYIVNPYKESPNYPMIQKEFTVDQTTADPNISFDLKTKHYQTRQQVTLGVKQQSEDIFNGKYMISVRKTDGFLSQNKTGFKPKTEGNSEIKNTNFYMPEVRGELISGKITSHASDVKNKKVAFSIIDKNPELKFTKTDDNGRFMFNLEKSNSGANIIIQVIEENKQDFTIEVDKPAAIDFSNLQFAASQFTPEFKNNITERLVSSQIENAYYNIKKDSILNPKDSVPFYGSLSTEFILDDYTRFKTMSETFTEILKGVEHSKTKDGYSIHIYDYDPNYESSLPVLVVIDGFVIEDLNELFAYDPRKVEKINVVRGMYYYGSKSFSGLIVLTSKDGSFETTSKGNFIAKPSILRPENKKMYYQPDYAANKNDRIPDYRHQLLWKPEVNLKNSNFSFYTSDVSGKFEIVLEGFSESGKPVFIRDYFEVSDSNLN
ncbi:hypothetical protein C4F50_10080 [Flavobacterium sp. KB82]|uniref:TonB-dependent receptor plug domain-containing protein n=2 Tax=Flavobacterium hungaricum TaxID=2082725 RepID=A0ABR9TIW9_9FLAO|nr:hypothetical protein [Flavobacterium hungaricum]